MTTDEMLSLKKGDKVYWKRDKTVWKVLNVKIERHNGELITYAKIRRKEETLYFAFPEDLDLYMSL